MTTTSDFLRNSQVMYALEVNTTILQRSTDQELDQIKKGNSVRALVKVDMAYNVNELL